MATVSSVQRLAKTVHDPRPLAVRVYESVRDQIVSGQIAPNTQLVQEQLAESLGVSRTPVRDALNRLAHEGMVTWIPGTGYLVNDLTDQDVKDVYQVRQSLESLAVRLAAGRHSRAQIAALRSMADALPAGEGTDWFAWNRDFHVALVQPAGNPLLLAMLQDLWDNPVNRLITREYARDQEHIDRMVLEHRAIVDAAEIGDADLLARLIHEHLHFGYSETSATPLTP